MSPTDPRPSSPAAWIIYPAVMTGAYALFAILRAAGAPLVAATYLPIVLTAVIIAACEWRWPYRAAWVPRRDEVQLDITFLAVVQLMLPPLVSLLFLMAIVQPARALQLPVQAWWPHAWPVWAQVVLMILAVDFLRYWLHRAAHETDIALTPRRKVDADVLKAVLQAVRENRSIEVYYQSMGSRRTDPIWRRMTPHAFGYDGFRWHVRAYCHIDEKYKDFLLPRILGVRHMAAPGPGGDQDALWKKTFDIEIGPHPGLTPSQRAVVAKDYGMTNERAVLSVRYAMLFYVLKRLGLLGDASQQNPRTQHIVALNAHETERALRRADFEFGEVEQTPKKVGDT